MSGGHVSGERPEARHPRGKPTTMRDAQVDAVDLPPDLQAGAGVSGGGPGQLVPGPRHRPGQRGGHRCILALRKSSTW